MWRVTTGATNQSTTVRIVDDEGLAVEGLDAASFPDVYWSRPGVADAQITLSDLSAVGDAHADGGLFEKGGGRYRLDLPDAAFETEGVVSIMGEDTDLHLLHPDIQVEDDGGSAGPGERTFTYIAEVSGNPATDVAVWISTDNPFTAANTVAGTLRTDDNGSVEFSLDDDVVYYLWRASSKYNFTDPIQFRYSSADAEWQKWNGSAYEEWT